MSGRVLLYFEATAVVRGSKEDGGEHWRMIAEVLEALGCVDIHLREVEIEDAQASTVAP